MRSVYREEEVSIVGVEKWRLLQALSNVVASYHDPLYQRGQMDEGTAQTLAEKRLAFRKHPIIPEWSMEIDISKNYIDPYLFEVRYGLGRISRVVEELSLTLRTTSEERPNNQYHWPIEFRPLDPWEDPFALESA